MTQETATGIVLRTRPLTETSLIVRWLTAQQGVISTVAKGARRPKSPFRGQIDLFYVADFSFIRSRRSDLHTLSEVKLIKTHADLRPELAYVEQAAYCTKLIEQATEPETPLPGLFERFSAMLDQIPRQPPQPQTIFAFEMKLLADLGLQPDLGQTRLSSAGRELLESFLELDWSGIAAINLTAAQSAELRQFLHGFLIYNLDRIPKGRARAVQEIGAPVSDRLNG